MLWRRISFLTRLLLKIFAERGDDFFANESVYVNGDIADLHDCFCFVPSFMLDLICCT